MHKVRPDADRDDDRQRQDRRGDQRREQHIALDGGTRSFRCGRDGDAGQNASIEIRCGGYILLVQLGTLSQARFQLGEGQHHTATSSVRRDVIPRRNFPSAR